ncbi:DUF3311 domain-containing protein [Streptomyces sp. NPDC005492]|uniref:DUF3311 domain-containing protein n=1 Tax=Streptomyces sp. NPDC005492 TaxID=3156883 RepID=UPI0033BA87E8
MAARRRFYWLLALPFVWQVGLVPLVNGVSFAPFGIPFPMAWQMAGVVFATVIIGVLFLLDERSGAGAAEEAAFIAATEEATGAETTSGRAPGGGES